ncbi:NifU family protein [Capnocytophaga sputigena]|uniref:Fe/S biogenesis protein NfuA n=2 Tax=Capnocytophaga sputigena TaxID=1019 RepID=A0AAX2IF46_CAPSP|nr:NifU family protein [Capnocytophaga sputigena]ATA83020.1 NifU family protein [Capnocytophaga sputigena]EEB66499.1 NifU-like protein [Capnocytophaga sputigena ATCC 33612]SQA76658.1 Fe/S biogenesis protein NfuA [Capnocytophaga sputigena]
MTDLTLKIQPTANPDIIKLEANRPLVKGSYEFKNIDEAKNAPLAKELFYLPFVKTVYISSNFIALKRFPIVEWKEVQEEVAQQVLVYLQSGKDILLGEARKPMGEAITVYTETTPNPTVMKFVANKRLVPTVIEYKSIEEATEAPMAATLLTRFPFIEEVFFDDNYISLTKKGMEEWEMIAADLRDYIRKYLSEGRPIINPSEIKRRQEEAQARLLSMVTTDEISQQIVAIIEQYVKPAVASDGGNIQFISYNRDTHHVEVLLQGACSGCPSSTQTLKKGIEVILKDKLNNPLINVEALL